MQSWSIQRIPNRVRLLAVAVAIGLLSFWLASGLLAPQLELPASDLLFRLRGPVEQESAAVIVAIDDASFSQTGLQWPWPREYLAEIVEAIDAGDPRVIIIDIGFYEASNPEGDRLLADAIGQAGNVILANDIATQNVGGSEVRQLRKPIPELEQVAASLGLSNFPRDEDVTVRRILAFQEHNNALYFSWAMQAARIYSGAEEFAVESRSRVWIGEQAVELERQYLTINYTGPAGHIPTYSAYQVADGTLDPGVFSGKIVIVGATGEILHDTYPTPFGSEPPMPGVEVGANAVNTILGGRYVRTPGLAVKVLLPLLAAVLGMQIMQLKPATALAAIAATLVLYGALLVGLFIQARIILPITAPMLALLLSYLTGTSEQLYDERRRRAYVRSLFERYVAPAAIDQMLAQPESYALSGQRRDLTILFSDIRGFTAMSELLSPNEVVDILNEYLSAMTEILFKHEGTIDKFEGDAILAFFNAPLEVGDHASKAVLCAQEMIERVNELQDYWQSHGRGGLKIGIGIHTGQAFVGNIGSTRRMDYTVIGDTVNLASRLQDLTKEHGVPILFSEATRHQLDPNIETQFVANAQVKGRVQPVNVYTLGQFTPVPVQEGMEHVEME